MPLGALRVLPMAPTDNIILSLSHTHTYAYSHTHDKSMQGERET